MKTRKTVEKHVLKKSVVVEITCDCCGESTTDVQHGPRWWDGSTFQYGVLESHWSNHGDCEENSADICQECADWLIDKIQSKTLRRNAHPA